jgi:ankyrin repeat protein
MNEPTPASTAALPTTTQPMLTACYNGDTPTIVRLLKGGEPPNSIDEQNGWTPVMRCLINRHLNAVHELVARGADLSLRARDGTSVTHLAAAGGDLDCMKWLLANTTIDVNSTDDYGWTPLHISLRSQYYGVSKLLLMKGANLFAKDNEGVSALDQSVWNQPNVFLGQHLLNNAKDLKWLSVKPLLLLSASFASPNHGISLISMSSKKGATQRQSNSIAASVLANSDLVRHISTFFLPNIITADPDPDAPLPPDEVRERVEAVLGQR